MTPPTSKPRIPLDASAIATLHCARRYQLTCVNGCDTSNEHSSFGSACHIFLEHVAKSGGFTDMQAVIAFVVATANKFKLSQPLTTKLLTFASDWVTARHPIPPPVHWVSPQDNTPHPAVEFKFAFDLLETPSYIISLCGTVDLITLDTETSTLVLEDYKTSNHCRDLPKVESEYEMSLQLPLYMYAVRRLLPVLFPDLQADINMHARYRMLYHNFTPLKVRYSQVVSPWPTDKIEAALAYYAERVAAVWNLGQFPALEEGRCTKTCVKMSCPFAQACLTTDPAMQYQILSAIPKREYNPMEFR